ncbi:YndM family protein [Peribacillus saganii]|uniref:YndM family protein n=1 Tax=Peribacillus saganii TaxID=2303992 RepID=UPI0018F253A3|nr:YndM family protein [Peribacillus saganii]
MKNITIITIKFITCIAAFAIALDLFFDATIADIVSFSAVVTIISYFVVDRFILPHFGNTTATMMDFLITYLSVWIFGSVLLDSYLQIGWGSIIAATIVTAVEVFVHRYLQSQDTEGQASDRQQRVTSPQLAYGTEMAEEMTIRDEDQLPKI